MSKKIIILNRTDQGNYFQVNSIFWLTVPASQQSFRANPLFVSSYAGASQSEIDAIKSGQIFEQSVTTSYSIGTGNAAIGADLVARFTAAQSALNSSTLYQFFGSYWDGTVWTIQGG